MKTIGADKLNPKNTNTGVGLDNNNFVRSNFITFQELSQLSTNIINVSYNFKGAYKIILGGAAGGGTSEIAVYLLVINIVSGKRTQVKLIEQIREGDKSIIDISYKISGDNIKVWVKGSSERTIIPLTSRSNKNLLDIAEEAPADAISLL